MEKKIFKLRKEHLKLLERMCIDYKSEVEFGAPIINPKRPYGNSDVYKDIAEILNIKPEENGEFSRRQIEYMDKLHRETETALQIVLRTKKFKTGIYEADKHDDNWKLAKLND